MRHAQRPVVVEERRRQRQDNIVYVRMSKMERQAVLLRSRLAKWGIDAPSPLLVSTLAGEEYTLAPAKLTGGSSPGEL